MRLPSALLAASFLLSTFFGTTVLAAPPHWTPANFHGLTVGRAHRDDALRAFGSPDADTRNRNGEELQYKGRGVHQGDITVRLNPAGVVNEIQESFPIAIPRTQIYRELGNDAMTAHFSFAKCAGNAMYRDPRGAIELTFYPSLGIVFWPDQVGYDFAAMLYVAQMPGLAQAPACVGRH